MTRRERVLAAVNHIETDIVPYNISLTMQEYDKVAAYLGDTEFIGEAGNHLEMAYYDGFLEETETDSGYWRDDFGVLWNRNGADKDIGVIEGLVISEPSLDAYTFPEIDEKRIRKQYESLVNSGRDVFRFGSIGFSIFERAWTLRGMENLLMDMVMNQPFVDNLLDKITEYNMKVINISLEYDIDGFHFGDDWGQQKGLIMGPEYWKKYIKPRMARMYSRVKEAGKIVSQHSCGDIHEIFPDLIDIGLDVYQTFQPEIYDIKKIKQQYGRFLTFWGGISTQRLLPFATPEKVREVTLQTIDIMKPSGGYIASPTHDVPGDVPPENIAALIDTLKNQGT